MLSARRIHVWVNIMNQSELKKWLSTLGACDLIDAETAVREARERKKNEGRVKLIRVEADGMNVAFFREGDMKGAIEYLLAHVERLSSLDGMIRTDLIRVPESQVDERLAWRWWE